MESFWYSASSRLLQRSNELLEANRKLKRSWKEGACPLPVDSHWPQRPFTRRRTHNSGQNIIIHNLITLRWAVSTLGCEFVKLSWKSLWVKASAKLINVNKMLIPNARMTRSTCRWGEEEVIRSSIWMGERGKRLSEDGCLELLGEYLIFSRVWLPRGG